MNHKKKFAEFHKMLLALVVVCLGFTGCSKEENSTTSMGSVLANQDIILYADQLAAGIYTLKYEQNGFPLENYSDICTLELQESGGDVAYEGFIGVNCAPRNADMIGVYDEEGSRAGAIELGSLYMNPGEIRYTFGVLSDVHIGYDSADRDFQKAG